jgi:anti-anti-sigma regulatory factor
VWHVVCAAAAVAIRIDIESEGPVAVLHVAGRLAGPETTQLTDTCAPMEANFVLDLSKLTFADDAGVAVIRALREKGAEIRGASSFIELLIKGESGYKNEES